ncbi:MAG: 3,4-dihydroxy-2-butanone-4-phosphate synthase [Acidobacteria bacterium]|nr:3,4-dihydroxy-2-butanone-4-phosphate synthase [Acidobacteriota bacterium]MBI3655512.1 3,4-dihydroxy-2-butanone-4-phosphate synthase [Acidobacteriota bacterium]
MAFAVITDAIEDIQQGRMVIVVDDEDRENEGDLTMAAEKVTPEAINFMARHGRGLICLPMTEERCDELHLPPMTAENTSSYGTAFTIAIDARQQTTTGISAHDRAITILTAINPHTKPADLARPGHVFPLRARRGGVLQRAGQTEAAVDLARMAGLYPAGVICEIMNEDGTMARVSDLEIFAQQQGLKIITVADLIRFRMQNEKFVHRVAENPIDTEFGRFNLILYQNHIDGNTHLALVKGEIRPERPILVRVQIQSTLGDVFRALQGGTGQQLQAALKAIEQDGAGVLVYLRLEKSIDLLAEARALSQPQESGRRIGNLEESPLSTKLREHGIGAQILSDLGVHRMRLLTLHLRKVIALNGYGLSIEEQVPLELPSQKPQGA